MSAPTVAEHAGPRLYTTRDGVSAAVEHFGSAESRPCVFCGTSCGIAFGGNPAHIPCWVFSTAELRALALRGAMSNGDRRRYLTDAQQYALGPRGALARQLAPGGDSPPIKSARPARRREQVSPRTTDAGNFTAPAAVLHSDGLWLADGRRLELPDGEIHAGDLHELAQQLRLGTLLKSWTDKAGTRHERSEPGLIAITVAGRQRLGLEFPSSPKNWDEAIGNATKTHPFITEAITAGYEFRRPPAPTGDDDGADEPPSDLAAGGLRAWARIWSGRDRSTRIVFLETIDPRDVPILAADPNQAGKTGIDRCEVEIADPAAIARRLALYAKHTGYPFHTTVHTTGLAHLEHTRRAGMKTSARPCPACGTVVTFEKGSRKGDEGSVACPQCNTPIRPHHTGRELFAPYEPPEPLAGHTELDLSWRRRPLEDEVKRHRYLHVWDTGGAYLAAAGLELGIGQPTHHPDGAEFDPRMPGMHLVRLPYERLDDSDDDRWRLTAHDSRYPNPIDPTGKRRYLAPDSDHEAQAIWVPTPALEIATELWGEFEILESFLWHAHGRVFYPWYEQLRDARQALDQDDADAQAARDLLKNVYKLTFGMLESARFRTGKAGYAPHRRHHLVAKVRANLVRRIVKIGNAAGMWPVLVTFDAIAYLSDDPDPQTAWPGEVKDLGRGLGKFSHEASGLLADQDLILTGRGHTSLIPAREWDPTAEHVANAPYPDPGKEA